MDSKPTLSIHDLQEKKEHGNLEYPVAVYTLDLSKLYTGFVRWHWHEEMELSMVIKGEVEYCVAEERFLLRKGEAIIINQNILHSIHKTSHPDCVLQVVVFHPAYLFGYGETYMCTKYLTPIVGNHTMNALLINEDDEFSRQVRYYGSLIVDANVQRDFGYELATKGYLCSLWLQLLTRMTERREKPLPHSVIADETRTKQAILYIQNHYAENVTLDAIASAIHISKSECCRCFKRSLQMTPFEYLIKYRIFVTTLLMMQKDPRAESISDLALSVGFNSTSYYNKWFKHYLGCTPTTYRKRLREDGLMASDAISMPSFDPGLKDVETHYSCPQMT